MYKNDIGLSWEFSKFNSLSSWVLKPYTTDAGLLIISDGDSLVIRARIQEMILKAVVEERQACAEVANQYAGFVCTMMGAAAAETIALTILSRNFTEAKKQDTYHASEDEKV